VNHATWLFEVSLGTFQRVVLAKGPDAKSSTFPWVAVWCLRVIDSGVAIAYNVRWIVSRNEDFGKSFSLDFLTEGSAVS